MKKIASFLIVLAFLAVPAMLFAQQAQEEAEEAGQTAGETVEETGEAAGTAVEETGEAVQEGAEETGEAVQEGAEETGRAVQEGAEETGQAVQEGAEETGRAIDPTAPQDPQQVGEPMVLRLDELTDIPIASRDGEVEGSIQDVVITDQGDLTHLVVGVARIDEPAEEPVQEQDQDPPAFLQTEDTDSYLIPVDRVIFGQPNQAATLDMSMQEIEQQPVLLNGMLPAEIAEQDGLAQALYVLGSELTAYTFVSQDGEEIGGVEGFMLDFEQNRVVYIALAAGGFLGLGEKLVAVPMESITGWNLEDERLQTSLTEDQIDQAEGFDGDSWPRQAGQYQQVDAQEQPIEQ